MQNIYEDLQREITRLKALLVCSLGLISHDHSSDKKHFMEDISVQFVENSLTIIDSLLAEIERLLRKEYCKICGQELTEIRGQYPKQPKRKVCACCATEKLEWIKEQNNVEAKCSNNA
jgi:hypothetical protein